MGARLVLNLRSSRPEDVMLTGRSTSDGIRGFEMHVKSGLNNPREERVVFDSHGGEAFDLQERHLSPQERMRWNQLKSSSDFSIGRDAKMKDTRSPA
jgi:hypothetical protein